MNVTAKVVLGIKSPAYDHGAGPQVDSSAFGPDYADGRNKEWALATPSLNLTMTVKENVAERFKLGQHYTLTFTPAEA